MAPSTKNVALPGASGHIGSKILKALLETNEFNITVFSRNPNTKFPAGVTVKSVDFTSVPALTEALRGQDVVIDATSPADPRGPVKLMDAAAAANVYRFITSDYGTDPFNPKMQGLPIFARKNEGFAHLQQLAQDGRLTWSSVVNGPWLDGQLQSGGMGVDVFSKKIRLVDDGTNKFAWSTMDAIGKAVAGVLLHPEDTANRPVYIHSIYDSVAKVADLAQQALGSDNWTVEKTDRKTLFDKAVADYAAGVYTMQVFADQIEAACADPEYASVWPRDDNKLLGVKTLTDDEVRNLIVDLAWNRTDSILTVEGTLSAAALERKPGSG
ncbi:Isoflavone reductase family protein CipA [Fusarium sp. LHS14.1]|nr:Isoflavone reductase family protein CipA [Fusarium sp. LHS14.1]